MFKLFAILTGIGNYKKYNEPSVNLVPPDFLDNSRKLALLVYMKSFINMLIVVSFLWIILAGISGFAEKMKLDHLRETAQKMSFISGGETGIDYTKLIDQGEKILITLDSTPKGSEISAKYKEILDEFSFIRIVQSGFKQNGQTLSVHIVLAFDPENIESNVQKRIENSIKKYNDKGQTVNISPWGSKINKGAVIEINNIPLK